MTEPLSPGQALHLVDDPERAELARHTAEQQVFVAAEPAVATPVAIQPVTPPQVDEPTVATPAPPVAPEPVAPVPGRWRRLWRRLTGSD